jgi:hypothetical protein
LTETKEKRYNLHMTNKTCDDCGVKLHGECYVDGALLMCGPCAENLDNEREFDDEFEGEDMDGDFF